MTEFSCGDRVWCEDGRRAEFVASTPHGVVIRLGFFRPSYDGEEDEYFDAVSIVPIVFAQPPVEAVDRRVAELLAKETQAREALRAVQAKVREAEKSAKQCLANLAKHPPLDMLEALLEKRVTHFAVSERYGGLWNVQTFEEATTRIDTEYGRKKTELRMLALVGTGDLLEWRVNHYSDGNDASWHTVIPCLSYEEARSKVAEFCLLAASTLKPGQVNSHLVENAKKYGVDLPQWIPDAVVEYRAAEARKSIEKAEAALAAARAKANAAALAGV